MFALLSWTVFYHVEKALSTPYIRMFSKTCYFDFLDFGGPCPRKGRPLIKRFQSVRHSLACSIAGFKQSAATSSIAEISMPNSQQIANLHCLTKILYVRIWANVGDFFWKFAKNQPFELASWNLAQTFIYWVAIVSVSLVDPTPKSRELWASKFWGKFSPSKNSPLEFSHEVGSGDLFCLARPTEFNAVDRVKIGLHLAKLGRLKHFVDFSPSKNSPR